MKHEINDPQELTRAINGTARTPRTGPAIVSYWPAVRVWGLWAAGVAFFGWLVMQAAEKAAYDAVNGLML